MAKPRAPAEPESKPKTSSLLARFTASTIALALVVAGMAAVFTALINSRLVNEAMERTVKGYSISLARQILASDDEAFWRSLARDNRVALLVRTPEKQRAFTSLGEPTTAEAIMGSVHGVLRVDVPAGALEDPLRITTRLLPESEAVPEDEERVVFSWNLQHFSRLHDPLLYGHVLLLILVIGAIYLFQRSLLRPLQGLRQGVESVADGDFGVQVPVVRMDEIGQVATAFNQMTRRVEQMIADRERLLADVSHELRSPLARVKLALEMLPAEAEHGAKRRLIQNDVREMEQLISRLLDREWLRVRTDRLTGEPVDLVPVVRQVVDVFAERAPGVAFSSSAAALVVAADRDLMRVLTQNLVDNAVKFSLPDSQPVEVRLESAGDAVRLSVSDDGPGIAPQARGEVFKPFVKLDPSRGHRRGYGLGLNLCQRIVEAHGGTIELGDRGARGTVAIVELPQKSRPISTGSWSDERKGSGR